jgi:hypothetical protein
VLIHFFFSRRLDRRSGQYQAKNDLKGKKQLFYMQYSIVLTILYAFASLHTFENHMCLIINNNISHIILISSHIII